MHAVGLNLLMFLQSRSLWLWHIVGVIFFFALVVDPLTGEPHPKGTYLGCLVPVFMIGTIAASLHKETRISPAGFVLPGQVSASRWMLFMLGFVVSTTFTLMFLRHPDLAGSTRLSGFLSALGLAAVFYLLAVGLAIVAGNTAAFFGIPIMFLYLFTHQYVPHQEWLEVQAYSHPVIFCLTAIACGAALWRWLGSRRLSRRLCGSPFLPPQAMFNKKKQEFYQAGVRIGKLSRHRTLVVRFLESRFDAWLRGKTGLTPGQRLLAYISATSCRIMPVSAWTVLLVLALITGAVAGMGYLDPADDGGVFSDANLVLMLTCLFGASMPLPVHTSLLLTSGRVERSRQASAVAIGGAVLTLGACVCLYLVSLLIMMLFPELTVAGVVRPYHPIDLRFIVVPMALVPIFFFCQLLIPLHATAVQVLVGTITSVVMAIFCISSPEIAPAVLSVVAVLCWTVLFLLIRNHFRLGNLAGP